MSDWAENPMFWLVVLAVASYAGLIAWGIRERSKRTKLEGDAAVAERRGYVEGALAESYRKFLGMTPEESTRLAHETADRIRAARSAPPCKPTGAGK